MNTVVNKLGFDNGKIRLKSAYRQQKVWAIYFYTLLPLELLSISDGLKHKQETQ